MTLEPLGGSSAEHSFMYWGERQEWLVVIGTHRDASALERSNWEVITEHLMRDEFGSGEDNVAIEHFSNFAVGWSEVLLVRPGSKAHHAAIVWLERLANYPVADDEHYSMLEWDEEWCVRCDRGTREQHFEVDGNNIVRRLLNGCKFRSENDASELAYKWRTRRETFSYD